jgi:hypothetical protein
MLFTKNSGVRLPATLLVTSFLFTSCSTTPTPTPREIASSNDLPFAMDPHPEPLAKVCQFEQSVNQNPEKCRKILRLKSVERQLYAEYPSFQPEELRKFAERINAAYAAKAEQVTNELRKSGAIKENEVAHDGRRHRLTHSKTLGCAVGEFTVAREVPAQLQVGVFQSPGARFKTYSRFANGTTFVKADSEPDARSHSVKLIGARGTKLLPGSEQTLDFVMNNAPVFIFKSPERFATFFTDVLSYGSDRVSSARKLAYLAKEFKLPRITGRYDESRALDILTGREPTNLLDETYYSGIAHRWGSVAVKTRLKAVSCKDSNGREINQRPELTGIHRNGTDFYRQSLRKHLEEDRIPACWDFQVQVQKDPWAQPIEDSTVPWSESLSPFLTIGELRIEPQSIENPAKLQACESLSYSPWRVPAEMRPLGDLAKLRQITYYMSAKARREANSSAGFRGVSSNEPSGNELPEN